MTLHSRRPSTVHRPHELRPDHNVARRAELRKKGEQSKAERSQEAVCDSSPPGFKAVLKKLGTSCPAQSHQGHGTHARPHGDPKPKTRPIIASVALAIHSHSRAARTRAITMA
eukprot:CAMPEP_0204474046 /NCGR_PEP_ID=MMETSP0471-20130131/24471_1 /ASSEMBLY_ACC=CAM_ASM_000602 /TAXON_ID=2969 /ORGANISM="Oxyrrhis marina" /LENGTH=112 /DNA_ID=CAMNT_0051476375 /DNA_START=40 /DNA_END=374 /DNA_ORIENTATION=+